MAHNATSFEKETRTKNLRFLAITIPLILAAWITLSMFGVVLNPNNFFELPRNMRIAHITNLFFQNSPWDFPLTLTKSISEGISLGLTDNVPIMAIFYKLISSSQQYFGLWLLISNSLTAFFSYRICKNISSNYVIACLGAILMLTIPFYWYHATYNYVLAGQWTILWAYSLFFRKKHFLSPEWFSMLVVSCFVHPFFAFICFSILVSNIIHVYVYNHSVSVVKAASDFGNAIAFSLIGLSVVGVFYAPNFYTPYNTTNPFSFQISPDVYNPSYIHVGVGIASGFIIVLLTSIAFPKLYKYIKYFKPLISMLIIFTILSIIGGVVINDNLYHFPQFEWMKQYTTPIFTSGAKFIFPILWLLPIVLIHITALIEKQKQYAGVLFLLALMIIQIFTLPKPVLPRIDSFQPLPQDIVTFIESKQHINWVYANKIPASPPSYESLAYYAYQNNKHLNSTYTVRFPTGYAANIMEQSQEFFSMHFDPNVVYVMLVDEFPVDFNSLGESLRYKDVILFKISL